MNQALWNTRSDRVLFNVIRNPQLLFAGVSIIQKQIIKDADEAEEVLKKLETLWMGEASGPFSDRVLELAYEPERMGGMEDADAVGRVTDDCGDVLEIFLKARSGIVTDASFLCDGCGASIACGSAAAQLVIGKSIDAAKGIGAQAILEFLGGLPESHRHAADDWSMVLAEALGQLKKR